MSVAEIIRKLDDYLSRLREARALLADSVEAPKRGARGSQRPRLKPAKSAVAGRESGQQARPRSTRGRRTSKAAAPAESPQGFVTVSAAQTEAAKAEVVRTSDLPAKPASQSPKNKPASRSRRPSKDWGKPVPRPEIAKVATPLSGPVPSGVVVVSAAEAQRARERAVKSEPKRESLATTPQTGKAAFEALFGGESGQSGSSSA